MSKCENCLQEFKDNTFGLYDGTVKKGFCNQDCLNEYVQSYVNSHIYEIIRDYRDVAVEIVRN